MKQFKSLYEGLQYVTHCPLCKTRTELNDRDAELLPLQAVSAGTINQNIKGKLQFHLYDEDILTIDIETGECEVLEEPIDWNGRSRSAALFVRLGIDCNDCCQYYYVIRLHINLDNLTVAEVTLDSETISLEQESKVHEIKNSYVKETTEYSLINRSSKTGDRMGSDGMYQFREITDHVDKLITLPLVPLDLSNPFDTLGRITNLIIFS